MRMFPHTVTLYHCPDDCEANITILRGVLLVEVNGSSATVKGHDGTGGTKLYIPMGVQAVDGPTGEKKAYVGPVAYENAEDQAGLWTFPADGTAFFVKGEVVEPDMDRQELESKYDGVYSIVSVTERAMGSLRLQHWEIGAA